MPGSAAALSLLGGAGGLAALAVAGAACAGRAQPPRARAGLLGLAFGCATAACFAWGFADNLRLLADIRRRLPP